MKNILTLMAIASISMAGNAQQIWTQWAKYFGTTLGENATVCAADKSGNLYYAGHYQETIDLNPGSGNLPYSCKGNRDFFVSKIDKYGNLAWARGYGDVGNDYCTAIGLTDDGHVYIAGQAGAAVDFDEGVGVAKLTLSANYLLKLDSNGKFKSLKEPSASTITGLRIDGFNNVYLTGNFYGTNVDFDFGAGTALLSSKGGSDVFVTKIGSNGSHLWSKLLGGADNDFPNALAIDDYGIVYITGVFSGTADFDPGAGTVNLVSKGKYDAFVCKILSNGVFSWVKQIGTAADDDAQDVVVDKNYNVYIMGGFTTKTDFDPGAGLSELSPIKDKSQYLLKLNSKGLFVSVVQFGEIFINDKLDIEFDNQWNLYLTGNTTDTVDLNPGLGEFLINGKGTSFRMYVSVMDTSFNFITGFAFGDRVYGNLATFGNGGLYLYGEYWGKMDCDPSGDSAFVNSIGNMDIFIAKYELGLISNVQAPNFVNVKAYPNPTNDKVWIELNESSESVTVQITNNAGQQLSELQYNHANKFEIMLPEKPGIYFVKIIDKTNKYSTLRVLKY